VQLTAAQLLGGLLEPPREYGLNEVFAGVARVRILADKVFGMSVPDTCTALSFVLTTLNRTSRYKGLPQVAPVPVVPVATRPAPEKVPIFVEGTDTEQ
jgi:hypothetical protein